VSIWQITCITFVLCDNDLVKLFVNRREFVLGLIKISSGIVTILPFLFRCSGEINHLEPTRVGSIIVMHIE